MTFKQHKWSSYNYGRTGHKIKIEVFDDTKRRIDTLRADNKKDYTRCSRILKEKYGIDLNPEINIKNSINKEKDFLDKDLDW